MNCNYKFKKGTKKDTICNIINCKKHKLNKKKGNVEKDNSIITKITNLKTTKQNKITIMKHYITLKQLDPQSTEFYKHQQFLENSLKINWDSFYSIHSKLNDKPVKDYIDKIKLEFDKHIHGMENVKNEIINFVCKLISNPTSTKNILALHGSAGVCKTKFVKILSDILEIPMKIISLGGLKDPSFLLGHGFTYVESNNGVIIQSLIDTKIMNPILYFDELDKISEQGHDIYAILSNLTDSTVNTHFTDHYFRGIEVDLSRVFFIFTFNDISKIDKILLDRLNIIYIETPSNNDKITILSKHCLDDIITNIGIPNNITFDVSCYTHLIDYVDNSIDKNVSSGIRECCRIFEKILLEINKEILYNDTNINMNITFVKYVEYFNRLKHQFIQQNNDNSFRNMYI